MNTDQRPRPLLDTTQSQYLTPPLAMSWGQHPLQRQRLRLEFMMVMNQPLLFLSFGEIEKEAGESDRRRRYTWFYSR